MGYDPRDLVLLLVFALLLCAVLAFSVSLGLPPFALPCP